VSTIAIFGASSGLGAGLAEGLPKPGDRLWLVSRKIPPSLNLNDGVDRRWVEADLSKPDAMETLGATIGTDPVDLLVYAAGTWESEIPITKISSEEIYSIISTNVSGFVAVVVKLAINLRSANAARIVAIGSTAGLDNATGNRAAYAASKFGLRGATHALRELFRDDAIGVTCLSPGGIASDLSFADGKSLALMKHRGERIPIADFVDIINLIRSLSPAVCIKEIDMPAMKDNV
jgi:short-subunit dehydrogenase